MAAKKGIICFTFDDRNFEGWINSIDIFKKYNAHATFFFSGNMDKEALCTAKTLHDAGHTIGLHTKNHSDAPEYFEKYGGDAYWENEIKEELNALQKIGIDVSSFAYPNNRRTDKTDEFLSKYFKRFRAGNKTSDKKYIPVAELCDDKIMRGFGIGEYYNSTVDGVLDIIRHAARENLCVTFFSHNIAKDATFIHMPTSILEAALCEAQKEGMKVVGFDQLP